MLRGRHMQPTIPASDLTRARAWYAGKLGFTSGQEEAETVLYRGGEDRLFLLFPLAPPVQPSTSSPPGSWRTLRQRSRSCAAGAWSSRSTTGPGLRTVDGIARTPVGQAAWFKDSEGNVLTITQLAYGH